MLARGDMSEGHARAVLSLPDDDAFRFRHILIRDAAYDALRKAIRAELHERFADWIAGHGADLVELDEILGYHLEQAARYRAELGPAAPQVAAKASSHLAAAAPALRVERPASLARLGRRHVRRGPAGSPRPRPDPRPVAGHAHRSGSDRGLRLLTGRSATVGCVRQGLSVTGSRS